MRYRCVLVVVCFGGCFCVVFGVVFFLVCVWLCVCCVLGGVFVLVLCCFVFWFVSPVAIRYIALLSDLCVYQYLLVLSGLGMIFYVLYILPDKHAYYCFFYIVYLSYYF